MKKVVALIFVLVLCLSLFACAKSGDAGNKASSNDISKYNGSYYADGTIGNSGDLIPIKSNNPILILEPNNVAKVSLNPASGKGFTFCYTINGSSISLKSDFNGDGVPDTDGDAVRGEGTLSYDGTITLTWSDGLTHHFVRKG